MMLNICTPTPSAGCFQDTHWQYGIWTSKMCMCSHLILKLKFKKIEHRSNAHKTLQQSAARDAVYTSTLLFSLGKIFHFLWYDCPWLQVLFLMPFLDIFTSYCLKARNWRNLFVLAVFWQPSELSEKYLLLLTLKSWLDIQHIDMNMSVTVPALQERLLKMER